MTPAKQKWKSKKAWKSKWDKTIKVRQEHQIKDMKIKMRQINQNETRKSKWDKKINMRQEKQNETRKSTCDKKSKMRQEKQNEMRQEKQNETRIKTWKAKQQLFLKSVLSSYLLYI